MMTVQKVHVRGSLIGVVVVALLAFSVGLVAQTKPTGDAALKQEAATLVVDLRSRADDLRSLQQQVESSKGERRAIYRDELLRRWEAFAVKLDALVENVAEQTAKGLEPGDQLKAAKELTSAVAAGLSDAALVREASLVSLEGRRADASGDDRARLEREAKQESVIYNKILSSILDNIDRMKRLGIDSTAAGEQVDHLLMDRAAYLEGRLRLLVASGAETKSSLKSALAEEKASIQQELNRVDAQVAVAAEALRKVLDLMDRRGLETTSGREVLVTSTKEVSPGALDAKVAVGLLQQWMSDAGTGIREHGPKVIMRIIVALLIMLAFWFVAKLVAKIVGAAVTSSKLEVSKLLQDFFVSVAARTVLGIGLIVALAQMGLDLAPLLAGLGIAGFIVGFALQDTLSNFASGMMILVYRPYDVADAVEVAGVLGVVSEMSLVSTTIKTFDNQKLIVPNSKIWGNVIRNLTAEETRRVDLVFGISYGDDIAKAERLLQEEVTKHELVLAEPAPVIRVSELADSSVNFIVRPWAKTPDYWAVYWDLTRNVKLRFDQEGITIPFPQRDVHMQKAD